MANAATKDKLARPAVLYITIYVSELQFLAAIAPISPMVVNLALQELLCGHCTTLRSLDEDLEAAWYLWLNRQEAKMDFEELAPLGFDVDGMHVLGWYGIDLQRKPDCPVCGKFVEARAKAEGITLTPQDVASFTEARSSS